MSLPSTLGAWSELADRLDAAGRPAVWSQVPALASLATIHQLRDWTARGHPERADGVLGALVGLAAAHGGNDDDAALVVLHLLEPGATQVARRFRHLLADPESFVLGELAIQIRTFPFERRTRAHAANLLMDTQKAIWTELRPYRTDLPNRPAEKLVDPLATSREVLWANTYTDRSSSDDVDLVDMLLWAQRTGAVDAVDVAVLVELEYARELSETSPQKHVAQSRGWTVRTVQRRRDRALEALRSCAGAYIAAA